MRLNSSVWVSAYLRRCQAAGAFAVIEHKGAEEAGAIFLKILADGGAVSLFGPAPQTEADNLSRRFLKLRDDQREADADAYIARQRNFDPDLWVVCVEDREGRDFLSKPDEFVVEEA